ATDLQVRRSATHALATDSADAPWILPRAEAMAMGGAAGDPLAAIGVLGDALTGVTRSRGYSRAACEALKRLMRGGPVPTRAAAFDALARAADAEVDNLSLVAAALEDSAPELLVSA